MKIADKTSRPFSLAAQVKCRSYSYHLQRAIVDFGADVTFKEAKKKIEEHYKIEVPLSSVQNIVENHAKNIFEYLEEQGKKRSEGTVDQLIAEIDGSMIPVVDTKIPEDGASVDSRRNRKLRWQEARLCFARHPYQLTPTFQATISGGVERAGDLLYRAALEAGFGEKTKVHGLGDGAKWIQDQMNRVFGGQVKYLVDFYHVSEYLAAAGDHSWTSQKKEWLKMNQELLKANGHEKVLKNLSKRLPLKWSPDNNDTEDSPVTRCYKYINNRKNFLDYESAIEKELPIGSGEIESAHKYVIQKRLKLPGAWWRPEVAENMLSLRVLRANDKWDKYWEWKMAA